VSAFLLVYSLSEKEVVRKDQTSTEGKVALRVSAYYYAPAIASSSVVEE